MPGPLVVPLIAAGSAIASSGINAAAQGSMNRKSRKFARQQALLQRQYSLEDWAMQNEYNHPSAQMARLREAGLNPNLVYGNGADATAGPVRNSEPAHWNPTAPQIDLASGVNAGLSAYYDSQIKQEQINNLRVQNTVLEQERLLKASQVLATNSTAATSQFDLDMKKQLKDISLQAAQANLDKTLADTKYTLDSNDRAIAQQSSSLQEAAERILRSKAERTKIPLERQEILARIRSLGLDSDLKALDKNLREKGINPNDPVWMRMLGQLLSKFIDMPGQIHERGKQGGKREIQRWYPATP